MTRRQFLALTARSGVLWGTGAGAALAWMRGLAQASGALPAPVDLAAVKGPVPQAVDEAVALIGGMSRFVKKGNRVVLKPNMSFPNSPSMGTTTSPDVVAAVAGLCRKAGAAQILVLDYPVRRAEICMQRSGIEAACQGLPGTHVIAVTDRTFFEEVPVVRGQVLKRVEVMKQVLQADVLINLPVAKSHSATGVSLGLKGLMGLVWDRRAFHSRMELNQAIADLATRIRPALTVMDATRVLTSGGPGGPGTLKEIDTIVAGTDPVAVDAFTVGLAEWYGRAFSPEQVKHILYASRMGLGEIDTAKLNVKRVTLPEAPGEAR